MKLIAIGQKTLLSVAVIAVLGFVLSGCGKDEPIPTPSAGSRNVTTVPAPAATSGPAVATNAQTTCPIMEGRKINKSIYVDYQGKRVYFCCPRCPPEFNKDPAKYVKAMEDKGIVLDKTPETAK